MLPLFSSPQYLLYRALQKSSCKLYQRRCCWNTTDARNELRKNELPRVMQNSSPEEVPLFPFSSVILCLCQTQVRYTTKVLLWSSCLSQWRKWSNNSSSFSYSLLTTFQEIIYWTTIKNLLRKGQSGSRAVYDLMRFS